MPKYLGRTQFGFKTTLRLFRRRQFLQSVSDYSPIVSILVFYLFTHGFSQRTDWEGKKNLTRPNRVKCSRRQKKNGNRSWGTCAGFLLLYRLVIGHFFFLRRKPEYPLPSILALVRLKGARRDWGKWGSSFAPPQRKKRTDCVDGCDACPARRDRDQICLFPCRIVEQEGREWWYTTAGPALVRLRRGLSRCYL